MGCSKKWVLFISGAIICVVDRVFLYEDIYATVGDSVTIQCHSSALNPVRWQYRSFDEMNISNVSDGQLLISDYVNKSTINNATYDLTILDVEVDDSGEYWCIEDEGFGEKHVTKLFVTGMYHCYYMGILS